MSKKWNADIMIPTDIYTVRVIGATFAPSKNSGNPMIELKTEIVSPEVVKVVEDEITVAGVKCTNYFSSISKDKDGTVDEEKTQTVRERIEKFYKDLELDIALDWNNLDTKVLLGKNVYALVESEVQVQRKTPTAEQAKFGKLGDVLNHPVTGKPIIKYWPKIKEFYGVAPGSVNMAF